MTWTRRIDYYLDVTKTGGANPLLDGTSSSPLSGTQELMQGDRLPVRLWFRRPAGQGALSTGESLEAGFTIRLAGKEDVDDTSLLFLSTAFTEGTEGSDKYYEAELNLATTEIADALEEKDELTALVDIEVRNAGNTSRATFRLEVLVNQQVYTGEESEPTPATPIYPAPEDLMLAEPEGGSWRVKDGNFQLWNPTTEKYHTFFPTGPEGALTTSWGAGED